MNVDQLARHLKILARTNAIIAEIHLRHVAARTGLFAFAALVASFGVVMLGVALFLFLEQSLGAIWAAVVVGAGGLVLALIVALVGAFMKPPRELALANQVSQSAMDSVTLELKSTTSDLSRMASLASLPALALQLFRMFRRPSNG